MAEYIEREALFEDIFRSVVFTVRKEPSAEMRGANKIMDRIKCAPAADVAPVVHGRWITSSEKHAFSEECSVCGCGVLWHEGEPHRYNYCPNCGAKMDVTDINVGSKE